MISLADVFSRSACIRSSVHKSSSMTIVGVVVLIFSPPFFPLAIPYYLIQQFSAVKGETDLFFDWLELRGGRSGYSVQGGELGYCLDGIVRTPRIPERRGVWRDPPHSAALRCGRSVVQPGSLAARPVG